MEYLDEFPDWERLVEYYESSASKFVYKNRQKIDRTNFEELLNRETYQLWKLLKQM